MSGVIANIPKFQFFDSSGAEAANYKLYTYLAGTLTPATTYQDQALGSANTNPIILDARGECAIWLDSTKSYKFILQTPAGSTIWTTDNISGSIDAASAATISGVQTLTNKTITGAIVSGGTVTGAAISGGTISGAAVSGGMVEATSGPGVTQLSSRNKIINGDFRVNQRSYASAAAVGTGLYGHDRWRMGAAADSYTFAIVNNKTAVTIPAGKVLQQVIEGNNLQTGTYVLSWEGTAQGKIGAGALSASGVTGSITGGTNTTIEFGPGTVANVQLEPGSIATPFESRSISFELILCQRYYATGYGYMQSYGSPGNAVKGYSSLPVKMRATPTATIAYVPGQFSNVNASVSYIAYPEGLLVGDSIATLGIGLALFSWAASAEL